MQRQSLLADGRVLVTGGNLEYDPAGLSNYKGLNKVYTFNPFNETWTEQPYDAARALVSGPAAVARRAGRDHVRLRRDRHRASQNKQIDVFTPSPDMNGVGTLTTVATRSEPSGDAAPRPGSSTRACSRCPTAATWSPARIRTTPGPSPSGRRPANAFDWT